MKKFLGVLCLPVLFLLACDKAVIDERGYQIFTIKQGGHSSSNSLQSFHDSILKFNAIFDSSAIYSSEIKNNQNDVNKLFGMSDCGVNHHVNSARLGWRWKDDSLELFSYVYINTIRKINFLTSCKIGEEIACSITASNSKYIFDIKGVHYEEVRSCNGQDHWLLHPYFGGDEVAQHDVVIRVNYEIKT